MPKASWIALPVLVIGLLGCRSVVAGDDLRPRSTSEWTVMVYINGKNNLEPEALSNFHSMASVENSENVNVIVELGRPSKMRYTSADGDWSGVYRFRVKKDMLPVPDAAVEKVVGDSDSNMGDPQALSSFVGWVKQRYPAKHYMLVIWNHGQGWRLQLAKDEKVRADAAVARVSANVASQAATDAKVIGGFKAVSSDDDTGSILYNRDVQDVVSKHFADRRLDLLGFDACLMAMIETAYALSPSVDVMVASEELEPGAGWDYGTWLSRLVKSPTMSAKDLGTAVVDAYHKFYGDAYLTTLSLVSLKDIRVFSHDLSTFSTALVRAGEMELAAMRKARTELESYGQSARPPLRTSVDLLSLLQRYEKHAMDEGLIQQSSGLRAKLEKLVLSNYASKRSSANPGVGKPYGSLGLAIYYPESKSAFEGDAFHDGYLKETTNKPVEFVRSEAWPDLLYVLLDLHGT